MTAPCGTYAAAQRHRRDGEPIDDACRDAKAEYMRGLRSSSPDLREREQWQVRTRKRALERLAVLYPEKFAELVANERRQEPDPRLASASP